MSKNIKKTQKDREEIMKPPVHWSPFRQANIMSEKISQYEADYYNDKGEKLSKYIAGYYVKYERQMIHNFENIDYQGATMTVKHLKVSGLTGVIGGISSSEFQNLAANVIPIGHNRSNMNNFIRCLKWAHANVVYKPRGIQNDADKISNIRNQNWLVLSDDCLVRTNPEWVLASAPITFFGEDTFGRFELEVDIAKNLRPGDKISLVVIMHVDNSYKWTTVFKGKLPISYEFSYTSHV